MQLISEFIQVKLRFICNCLSYFTTAEISFSVIAFNNVEHYSNYRIVMLHFYKCTKYDNCPNCALLFQVHLLHLVL